MPVDILSEPLELGLGHLVDLVAPADLEQQHPQLVALDVCNQADMPFTMLSKTPKLIVQSLEPCRRIGERLKGIQKRSQSYLPFAIEVRKLLPRGRGKLYPIDQGQP